MSVVVAIKRIAALCLLISFFLPLSQCTWQGARDEAPQVVVIYAYSAYSWPSLGRASVYAAFFWPAALSIAVLVWPALRRRGRTVAALELLFTLGSAWMVFVLAPLGSLRYGGYLAWGAVAVYFCAALADLLVRFLQRRRSPPDPRQNEPP